MVMNYAIKHINYAIHSKSLHAWASITIPPTHLSLDGMLVHRKVTDLSNIFAGTHFYTGMEIYVAQRFLSKEMKRRLKP